MTTSWVRSTANDGISRAPFRAAAALKELQTQISLLVSQINNQPEDVHELYELLHQKLNELRSTGQPLPKDLAELERRMLEEFPKP